jgi:UDP-GlcNAc:undecaprenyl-phosphate GlcNAc-1-phosphate transferase
METIKISLTPFLLSFIISLASTPLLIYFFKKFNWLVDPKKTPHPAHIHTEPVPKGGGIPVFIAFVVTVCLFVRLDKHLVAILLAGLITLIIGVIDDVKGLNPYVRLGINFLVAIIVISSGIGISYISNPFGGVIDLSWPRWAIDWFGHHEIWVLADLLALFWLPVLMNAINWSSGVDGQISGVVVVAALVLGGISLNYSADITQWPVSVLAFSLAGGFAGLTIYHYYPQKIMPGYSATSLAGLILGVISILATAKVGALIMVLAIPLFDFGYLIIKRIKDGKSPVWGGRDHLHHRLLALGWGKRRIAVLYWGLAAVTGVVSLTQEPRLKIVFVIGLVLITLLFLWKNSGRYSNP